MPTVTVTLKWTSYGYILDIQGLQRAGPIIAAFLDCKQGARWYEEAQAGCRTRRPVGLDRPSYVAFFDGNEGARWYEEASDGTVRPVDLDRLSYMAFFRSRYECYVNELIELCHTPPKVIVHYHLFGTRREVEDR